MSQTRDGGLLPGRRTVLTGIAALAGLSLSGCDLNPNAAPPGSVIVKIGTTTDVVTFGPANSVSITDLWVMNLMYPPLSNVDTEGVPTPGLGQSYEFDNSGTVATIKLDKGYRWSDGVAITASDVAFTLNAFKEYGLLQGATLMTSYSSAQVVDDQTLKVKLKGPNYAWGEDFFRSMVVIPEHVLKPKGDLSTYTIETDRTSWVGGGPYVLTEITRGQRYVLAKNEGWPKRAEGNHAIDRVEFLIYPDTSTMQLALQTGDVDIAAPMVPAVAAEGFGEVPGIQVDYTQKGINYSKLTFNTSKELVSDKRVRRALMGLIDTEALIQVVLAGRGTRGVSPVLPIFPKYSDPNMTSYSFTPQEARALLQSAGWSDTNNDGYFDNVQLTLGYDQGSAEYSKVAQLIRDDLAKAGVRVKLAGGERATTIANAKKGKFDLYIHKLVQDYNPATALWLQFDSSNPTGLNYSFGHDQKLDSLLASARRSRTEAETISRTKMAAAHIHDEALMLPLYSESLNNAFSDRRFAGYIPNVNEVTTMVSPYSLSQVVPNGQL